MTEKRRRRRNDELDAHAHEHRSVPLHKEERKLENLEKEKIETVVVTCIDALHNLYIVPALEAGGK